MSTTMAEVARTDIFRLSESDLRAIKAGLSRRFCGTFTTRKCDRPLLWRSLAEIDAWSLLEVDESVRNIRALPHVMTYVMDGRKHRHIPAFEMEVADHHVVLDAVSDHFANSPEREKRHCSLRLAYQAAGRIYQALPHRIFRREPRYANARLVLTARRHRPALDTEMALRVILADGKTHKLGDLEKRVPGNGTRAAALSFVARGMARADLWAPVPSEIGITKLEGLW